MPVDMFIKIKGERQGDIKGETRDKPHAGEIDVIGWTWGLSAPTGGAGGSRSGRVQVQHFTFRKFIDKSSPLLITALTSNENLPTVKLTCRKQGNAGAEPVEFLIIAFENASVIKLSRNIEGGDERLIEDITLMFETFTEDFAEQGVGGKSGDQTTATYSMAQNK